MNDKKNKKKRTPAGFSLFCLFLALLSGIAVIMAALGSRWDWWSFRTGFFILNIGGYMSLAAGGLALAGSIWSGLSGSRLGFALALAALICSVTVSGTLWKWKERAKTAPRIHDITTDMEKPPLFKAILPLRKNSPNTVEYGGPELAAKQQAGYPEIGPLSLPDVPDRAFQMALAAAVKMGWEIVGASQSEGRIEATDTTFWFGFKDDIVVRITPEKNGSRVDVRSISRVGMSDVGTNAARIERFLKQVGKG